MIVMWNCDGTKRAFVRDSRKSSVFRGEVLVCRSNYNIQQNNTFVVHTMDAEYKYCTEEAKICNNSNQSEKWRI